MAAIDYNLLKPLRALLEERSVTRAAARMHVSQPTMSTLLARLRVHYGDVLLVRRGNQHVLTPLGERLLAALPQVIVEADQIFRLQSRFDPVTSTRSFSLAGVDYAVARIAPALTRIVEREAPNVRFEFPAVDARLVNGLPDVAASDRCGDSAPRVHRRSASHRPPHRTLGVPRRRRIRHLRPADQG